MKKQTIYNGLLSVACMGVLAGVIMLLPEHEDVSHPKVNKVIETSQEQSSKEEKKENEVISVKKVEKETSEQKMHTEVNQETKGTSLNDSSGEGKQAAINAIDTFNSSTLYITDDNYPSQRLKDIEDTLTAVKPFMTKEDFDRFENDMNYRYKYIMIERDVDLDGRTLNDAFAKTKTQEEAIQNLMYVKKEMEKTIQELKTFESIPNSFVESHMLTIEEYEQRLLVYDQLMKAVETGNRRLALAAFEKGKKNNSHYNVFGELTMDVLNQAKCDIEAF